ncbi:MAG: sigma-70 family RNA polymerase sigma factor [Spirochaetota bacterium]|nr:sigma-70 family RNA polymerase sigma factor [Spirochaetota bacterium]
MRKKSSKRENFSRIYIEYYPLVFNAVYTKVGNRDDTSDICQDVFLIFYDKFEEIDNARKWLLGTMRNVIYRFYEKKAHSDIDIDNIDKMFADVNHTFTNGFRDTRIIINDAIENIDISEEERIILEYIAFYNYSYSTTGRIMGLSKRQVGYKQGFLKK